MVSVEKSDARKKEELFSQVIGLAKQNFPHCDFYRNISGANSLSVFKGPRGLKRIIDPGEPIIKLTCGNSDVEIFTPAYLTAAQSFADEYQKIIGVEVTLYTHF